MQKIILGRNGNQPFKIDGTRVSREHAEIVIDDNNIWTLKDLNSTTGTFIRDEDTGILKQISCVTISPMTFICLGPDNSFGCFFYARQVLNPGNYDDELDYMNKKEDEYEIMESSLSKKKTYIEVGLRVALFVVFGIVSFFIFPGNSSTVNFIRLGFTSVISQTIPFFFDLNKEKKKLKDQRVRFHHCPNPTCSRKMKESEIRDMDCIKCHCK